VTTILAFQRFEAFGLQAFGGFSTDAANLSNNGYDTSYGGGLKLGVQADVGGGVTLGASYQIKMMMTEVDKYAGLFAEQGDFDIPATVTIGTAWKINPERTLALDIQQIFYSDVKSVGNSLMPSLTLCAGLGPTGPVPPVNRPANCLGGNNGSGFGWKHDGLQAGLAVGNESGVDGSRGRIAWRSADSVLGGLVQHSRLAVIETHYTAGFTWAMNQKTEISVAGMYALEHSRSGPKPA
jgi:long-chain fatty acid transport protein